MIDNIHYAFLVAVLIGVILMAIGVISWFWSKKKGKNKRNIGRFSVIILAAVVILSCNGGEDKYKYVDIYVTQSGKTYYFVEKSGAYFITEGGDKVHFYGTYKVEYKERNLLE